MTAGESRERIRAAARLKAFISVTTEAGAGTPVGVKDVVDVAGTITTGGASFLPETPSDRDAPIVEAMRVGGCVVVGKTNLHEFAFGVTSANPHHGAVVNPRAPERTPGGSSGGSAAAVAAGLVVWALGTDTGGSIRIPAAYCSVVGFKPTIGTFDTEGVIPLSRSLDTLGPLARDVDGAVAAFSQMRGRRPDPLLAPRRLDSFRVGVIRGWGQDLDEPGAAAWRVISNGFPAIDFPSRSALNDAGFTILSREAASFHRKWIEAMPERYGKDVLEPLLRGLAISRQEYVAALLQQSRLRAQAAEAMESNGVDALVVPATRIVAPRLGEQFERPDLTGYTRPFNTTGQPVVCIPVPGSALPVGIQIVGRHGDDDHLLEVARAFERELDPRMAHKVEEKANG